MLSATTLKHLVCEKFPLVVAINLLRGGARVQLGVTWDRRATVWDRVALSRWLEEHMPVTVVWELHEWQQNRRAHVVGFHADRRVIAHPVHLAELGGW